MTGKKNPAEELATVVGSGNVFAELGFPDAEERFAKANLVIEIARTSQARRLTQVKAAKLMGIDQPKVSKLLRGDLRGFSTHRIRELLTRLGRDVEILIGPAKHAPALARASGRRDPPRMERKQRFVGSRNPTQVPSRTNQHRSGGYPCRPPPEP